MEEMERYEREHFEILRELAPECAVLLKRGGDFPLETAGRIALFGGGARRTVKGGTGSGDVNSRFCVTVEQGLRDAGFEITSTPWLDGYDRVVEDAHRKFVEDIKARAKLEHKLAVTLGMGAVMPEPEYSLPIEGEGDTALYVLARSSGEGNDRSLAQGDYRLTETEIRDILTANGKYSRFMLVLNVGGPVDLTPVMEVDNILLLSQLGAVTGATLADILLGKAQPSGKLASTWAAAEPWPELMDFGGPDETRYREGIYVGYRYFDAAGVKPLFPFGFGLGYTDFTYGVSRTRAEGPAVTVETPVFNSGRYPGRETVQVYVSVPSGRLDQPVKALAGYAKTGLLAPGQAETVSVRFDMRDLAGFDRRASAYVLERGEYIVLIGPDSSKVTASAVLELENDVTVRSVGHVGGSPDFQDWRPELPPRIEPGKGVPRVKLDEKSLTREAPVPAEPSPEALERVSKLSDEELIYMCCGQFSGGKIASVIGSASLTVAGAAGESCGRVRDIPGLVMADGPAGLRLTRKFTRDKNGAAHSLESPFPAGMEELLGGAAKFLVGLGRRKPRGPVYTQYCTAIPIGTALAQSWNTELCRRAGTIVGEEMERFGVDLWLAPAMNIHRSPLCGRNFEYYSEDPLVTGLTAAAVTRGVQSRPGRGVTVKHFCCNNQETNRFVSDSLVSERALREIYLRGFEICIRACPPAAVMTSYNLLNGVHTSEREDLSEELLRGEWGFSGIIMTDWVVAAMGSSGKHRMALSAPTVNAMNVFMPGSAEDYRSALRGLKEGEVSRDRARRCAAFLTDKAWSLKGR